MHRFTQSATIKQGASLATYALAINSQQANMSATIAQLKGSTAQLQLVTDEDLKPFAQQAQVLTKAAIRYLNKRTQANRTLGEKARDKLADMMIAFKGCE